MSMDFPIYLAMTAAEFSSCRALPPKIAYMACHFSPYGTGLSNFPPALPEGSMLILNDRTPIAGHDPDTVAAQLREIAEKQQISRLLLDFQRPDSPALSQLIPKILEAVPCPVGISSLYARHGAAVLLPPVLEVQMEEYFSPWQDYEIWLELALGRSCRRVDGQGCHPCPVPADDGEKSFFDERLCCQYHVTVEPDHGDFLLFDTPETLSKKLEKAEQAGAKLAIGLYQELGAWLME